MFISQLKNKLVQYDRFGEHRINGLKAIFIAELLFTVNFIYALPHPYFYYFYIPLTAFAAEVAGYSLCEKYLFFTFSVLGTTLAVWFFGIFVIYKTFFVFFVFFYSFLLYLTAVYWLKSLLVPVPLILSLAAYSLTYGNSDANFYVALNHVLESLLALAVALFGLLLFPKHLYLGIWRRAFASLLAELEKISYKIYYDQLETVPIVFGLVVMERYSGMLSRRKKSFSILKITLLASELVMAMSYLFSFREQISLEYVEVFQRYVGRLHQVSLTRSQLNIEAADLATFGQTYELRCLHKLITSWNYLCLNA